MFDEGGERSRSHAIPPQLMQAQADALGIAAGHRPRRLGRLRGRVHGAVARVRGAGITQGLFGDIDLQPHRDWEEKVCAAAGLQAELPLWQEPRRALVDELLALGYRARVVCVDARFLDASFCGREFDAGLPRRPARGRRCLRRERRVPHLRVRRPAVRASGARTNWSRCTRSGQSAPALGHHFVAELR